MARPGRRRVPHNVRHTIHRLGPRGLVDPLRRTPGRAGDHPGMRRLPSPVLPRRSSNPRTDGNLPDPRLQPRDRTASRIHRHRRTSPHRGYRRVGSRPHHNRLRRKPVLPQPAGNPRTDGNLPGPGAQPGRPVRNSGNGKQRCPERTRVHHHHNRKKSFVRNTHQ